MGNRFKILNPGPVQAGKNPEQQREIMMSEKYI